MKRQDLFWILFMAAVFLLVGNKSPYSSTPVKDVLILVFAGGATGTMVAMLFHKNEK